MAFSTEEFTVKEMLRPGLAGTLFGLGITFSAGWWWWKVVGQRRLARDLFNGQTRRRFPCGLQRVYSSATDRPLLMCRVWTAATPGGKLLDREAKHERVARLTEDAGGENQARRRPRKGELLELELGAIADQGRTVAKCEGFVIFVRGGVPGDRVLARMTRSRSSHGEARVEEVLAPSPQRREARCDRFGVCGGCSFQNLDYAAQLEGKRELVRDPLQRLGGLGEIAVAPCLPSPDLWNYRNKMEFSFARRRWLTYEELDAGIEGQVGAALGLHVPRVYDKVVEIGDCQIQDERANQVLAFVREFARDSELEAYESRSRQGFWRFLVIRSGRNTGEMMVNLVTAYHESELATRWAEEMTIRFPFVSTLINGIAPKPASAVILEEVHVLHGPGHITESVGELRFEITPASFFQPNTRAAEVLYAAVAARAGDLSGQLVFDLYCGTGTIALYLARAARKVVGLELSDTATACARRNATLNGISNAAFTSGDVRGTLANAARRHGRPDLVILDPPRAGNHPKFLRSLLELAPARIVHVSCNPGTLARDLALLAEAGYSMGEVQPVDLFPHTPHVESVVALARA